MPANVKWYTQDTVVLATFTGVVTADEQNTAMQTFIDYLDATTHPIHAIIDWRGVTAYPFLGDIVKQGTHVLRHRNLGWIVIVGMQMRLLTWTQVFNRIAPFHFQFCATIDEAVQFLNGLGPVAR